MAAMTFVLEIDALDEERATFKHLGATRSLAGLWLDREVWEDMGRPSALEISPRPQQRPEVRL